MKTTLLSLALVAGTAAAQAQGISLGVKAGPSYTNLIGNDAKNSQYKWGFHGGVMADIGFAESLSLHPELLYSMKGREIEQTANDRNLKLNYLDIPVMLRYKADGLYFEAGPQLSVLLSGKAGDVDYTNEFKRTVFGYGVGLGYTMESGVSLGLRYSNDFNNIIKVNGFQVPGEQNVKNNVFTLSVGYSFGDND
ncbi:porin family protein [Hymenobacter saemangeumensis]|uniref:Porin family protein n=1 Tax=Hymenobacter saemangeumensis TaxID=1084522 RepID=A0ABP8IPD6_9BACT